VKKFIIILSVLLCFSSCAQNMKQEDTDSLDIVCSVFPAYDWIRALTENTNANITLIPSNGTDIHSYQPTVSDIIKIKECDLFVYSGTEEKSWFNDIEVKNFVDISETDSHGHRDEHSFLSLSVAAKKVTLISKKLAEISPENEKQYNLNMSSYKEKLQALDEEFRKMTKEAKRDTVLVADRFPFKAMFDDYKINYFAAFEGCSAESEVSFETITTLARNADKLNLKCVLTTEIPDIRIAEAVISNTKSKNLEIFELNSMQAVKEKDISSGITYIDIMKKNLEVLREALNL